MSLEGDLDDMQPLLRVDPYATVQWGQNEDKDALSSRPQLALKVAQCIANWSELESLLGLILGRFLETDTKAALAIFAALENRSAQRRILNAAAETKLGTSSPDHLSLFQTLMRVYIKPLTDQRDKLAHWWWCISDDLPNDLIIIRPTNITLSRLFDVLHTPENQDPPDADPEVLFKHAYVIGEKFLTTLRKDMLAARECLLDFSGSLWNLNTAEKRAECLRRLSNEPRIRQAMDRQNEDRQKIQEANKSSPPSAESGKS